MRRKVGAMAIAVHDDPMTRCNAYRATGQFLLPNFSQYTSMAQTVAGGL